MRNSGKSLEKTNKSSTQATLQPSPGLSQIISFLFNRNILVLILLSSIPAEIAAVGFLNYFSPIYLDRIGVSQSDIGRIFMIHGLCLIYIAPYISKYSDKSGNKKLYIVANGILGSSAFILFFFFNGVMAMTAAVLMLGLAASFSACRSAYMLKLKITQELGQGKALGIMASVGRVGQVLGPLTFGWLIVSGGIEKGVLYFGVAYAVAALLLFIFLRSDKKSSFT